jgi:hypothetical protein
MWQRAPRMFRVIANYPLMGLGYSATGQLKGACAADASFAV